MATAAGISGLAAAAASSPIARQVADRVLSSGKRAAAKVVKKSGVKTAATSLAMKAHRFRKVVERGKVGAKVLRGMPKVRRVIRSFR